MAISRKHIFTTEEFITASGINEEFDNLVDGINTVSGSSNAHLYGFKNKIINGNFDIWQRNSSMSSTGVGSFAGPDRWITLTDGNDGTGSRQWSRQAFTLGQTDVPGEPRYFARFAVTSVYTGATYHRVGQAIESVRTFAGETVSISGYIKSDASRNITVKLIQNFGTGGTPSSEVETNVGTVSATTSWQQFEFSVTLPSISGKILGTDDNDYLLLCFDCPGNTTFQLDLARIQVEKGSTATDFDERPVTMELILCQRYFEKSYDLDTPPGTATTTGCEQITVPVPGTALMKFPTKFKVRKRAIPTLKSYSPQSGSSGKLYVEGSDRTATYQYVSETSGVIYWSNNTSNKNHQRYHWTADAELL